MLSYIDHKKCLFIQLDNPVKYVCFCCVVISVEHNLIKPHPPDRENKNKYVLVFLKSLVVCLSIYTSTFCLLVTPIAILMSCLVELMFG